MFQIAHPFRVAEDGRIAQVGEAAHIEQMIAQVLFTNPGERVNRPDFGCGLDSLVFEPLNSEVLAVTQALVRGSLLKWLGDLIHIDALSIAAEDSRLTITLSYGVLSTQSRYTATFTR